MLFPDSLFLLNLVPGHEKARRQLEPAGLVFPISLAESVQAMAVRRHGNPMMVMVGVMADASHLSPS